jgi:putative FmdB family regulatory protein
MPMYEFECDSCGERFEALVDVGTSEQECRICGAEGAQRALSAPSPPARHPLGERRKLEEKRRGTPEKTKQRFIENRKKMREAAKRSYRARTGGDAGGRR